MGIPCKTAAGHAEMAGKSLFFKYNTGPSGHGAAAAAGQALALKIAGHGGVRVFVTLDAVARFLAGLGLPDPYLDA